MSARSGGGRRQQAFPQRYGKYELLERIGEGGMAEVFRPRACRVPRIRKILVLNASCPTREEPDFVSSSSTKRSSRRRFNTKTSCRYSSSVKPKAASLYMAMEFSSPASI